MCIKVFEPGSRAFGRAARLQNAPRLETPSGATTRQAPLSRGAPPRPALGGRTIPEEAARRLQHRVGPRAAALPHHFLQPLLHARLAGGGGPQAPGVLCSPQGRGAVW